MSRTPLTDHLTPPFPAPRRSPTATRPSQAPHQSSPPEVLTVENLTETAVVFFSIRGDGIVEAAIGARGPDAVSGRSSASFRGLPEGHKFVSVYAWVQQGSAGGAPGMVSTEPGRGSYRLTETGNSGVINIQGGITENIVITAISAGSANILAGKYMLNGHYFFEATDRYAGSVDGSNWTVLYIDNAGTPGQSVEVSLNTVYQDEVGLFLTLPPASGVYDTPGNWNDTVSGVLDANGDFAVGVMARPDVSGRDVRLDVAVNAVEQAPFSLRIAGLANLNVSGE